MLFLYIWYIKTITVKVTSKIQAKVVTVTSTKCSESTCSKYSVARNQKTKLIQYIAPRVTNKSKVNKGKTRLVLVSKRSHGLKIIISSDKNEQKIEIEIESIARGK